MKTRWIIGIDPGSNTGIAVWDAVENQFALIGTMQIHKAMAIVYEYYMHHENEGLFIRIEDARQATFSRNNQKDICKAQGAGSVKRDCSIWQDYLQDMGIEFQMTRPRKAITKMDAELFQKVTGWKDRTSSHARDAALLVFQYKPLFKPSKQTKAA